MDMKTNTPYPTSPPAYSEAMTTPPQPPPLPPPLPPYQYPPQYQPQPSSFGYTSPYPAPPWVPQQPTGNPETSFTETLAAQHNSSYQYNPTVVHVVADAEYNETAKKHTGCCLSSCISLIASIIIIVILVKVLFKVW